MWWFTRIDRVCDVALIGVIVVALTEIMVVDPDTIFLEIKQGPYTGIDEKERF